MATKIITVEATPPSESTGADYNKGAPLNAAEFDQNIVNLRAAVDRKAALNNPTFTGTVTLPSTTSIGDVSATELQYLSSVTSNVQDQINSKQATITTLSTNHGGTGLTSFTSGGVVYASSTSALTTGSGLVFDGTNLGLGVTPDPYAGAKLQVRSSISATNSNGNTFSTSQLQVRNLNGQTRIGVFANQTDNTVGFVAGGSSVNPAFTWRQNDGTAEQMTLDSSGNLGIGTSSPQYKGHFYTGAASGYGLQIGGSSGTAGNYTGVLFSTSDGSGAVPAYNGAIRLQATASSPSYQDPDMLFMVQDRSTYLLANMTEKMRLTGSGNLGIGVTPSAWGSGFRAMNVSGYGSSFVALTSAPYTWIGSNWYNDGSTDRYVVSNSAALYRVALGSHAWFTAPSGTAGDAISFTQAMTLDASGNWLLGRTSSSSYRAQITGATDLIDIVGTSVSAQFHNKTADVFMLGVASGDSIAFATGGNTNERMRLDSSGNLLVGTTSVPSASVSGFGVIPDSTGVTVNISSSVTESDRAIGFYNPNGLVGGISTNGSSTSYNTSSDYRLKEDYKPVADAIVRLNQLKPVNFAWKINGERCDGFLAHELQEVIPEAATGTKDEMRTEEYEVSPKIEATFDEEGNELTPAVEAVMGEREVPVYQGIDQSKIVPLLTAALQEAVAKIESLTERIAKLETKGE